MAWSLAFIAICLALATFLAVAACIARNFAIGFITEATAISDLLFSDPDQCRSESQPEGLGVVRIQHGEAIRRTEQHNHG